jgi:hypothetical protein
MTSYGLVGWMADPDPLAKVLEAVERLSSIKSIE